MTITFTNQDRMAARVMRGALWWKRVATVRKHPIDGLWYYDVRGCYAEPVEGVLQWKLEQSRHHRDVKALAIAREQYWGPA